MVSIFSDSSFHPIFESEKFRFPFSAEKKLNLGLIPHLFRSLNLIDCFQRFSLLRKEIINAILRNLKMFL